MAAADDIKASLDLDQIAQFLGTDRATADGAVDEALGQLVGALDTNVSDAEGAVSLIRALSDHVSSSGVTGQVDINDVDAHDGSKIVSHVFSPAQIQSLGAGQGSGGSLLGKLLPVLAPIVLSYLANRFQAYLRDRAGSAGAGVPTQSTRQPDAGASGGLGDIIGDLLGGGGTRAGGGPGGLGDLLGGLFGATPEDAQTQRPGDLRFPTPAEAGGLAPPPDGGLRMSERTTTPTPPPQAPASGGGDLLGSILSDLLRGRR